MITLAAAYDRVMAKMEMVTESGCWIYMGFVGAHGYGLAYDGRKTIHAHRLTYRHVRGPIPEGLELDHLCRVRCCINPQHLEAVTHRVNVLRGISNAAKCATQTKCLRGHELSVVNLKPSKRGFRECRVCARVHQAGRNAKRGRCPKCGFRQRLRQTGRMQPHLVYIGAVAESCLGAGLDPTPGPTEER